MASHIIPAVPAAAVQFDTYGNAFKCEAGEVAVCRADGVDGRTVVGSWAAMAAPAGVRARPHPARDELRFSCHPSLLGFLWKERDGACRGMTQHHRLGRARGLHPAGGRRRRLCLDERRHRALAARWPQLRFEHRTPGHRQQGPTAPLLCCTTHPPACRAGTRGGKSPLPSPRPPLPPGAGRARHGPARAVRRTLRTRIRRMGPLPGRRSHDRRDRRRRVLGCRGHLLGLRPCHHLTANIRYTVAASAGLSGHESDTRPFMAAGAIDIVSLQRAADSQWAELGLSSGERLEVTTTKTASLPLPVVL